ncbi:MAG: hypothetical protein ABFE08_15350 [Armatimonadia bacterium]
MRWISTLILITVAVAGNAQTDLTAFEWGAMPTASIAVNHMGYRPFFTTDGKPDTGWVAPTEALPGTSIAVSPMPIWYRLEWRFPVVVSEMQLRQFAPGAYPLVKSIGKYALQADQDGKWVDLVSGDASAVAPDQAIELKLPQAVRTTALRLVINSAVGQMVGLSEVKVFGDKPVLPLSYAPAWQGRWIWGEPSLALAHREPIRRYLRRSFELADPAQAKEAWLVASFYDRGIMYLNGVEMLRDGSYNGGIMRQALVKKLPLERLVKGENVLAAQVEDIYEVGSQGLLAELVLIGQDGSRTVIPTDDKWIGQEDSGPVPDWRKPGYKDARYVPARVGPSPNTPWHWLWRTPYPYVAPQETMQVSGLKLTPQPLQPGAKASAEITFDVLAKPKADYAVILRLGQDTQARGHDYELWGAVADPETVKTSSWEPGRHVVKLEVDVPKEAPSPTPAQLLVSRPEGAVGLTSTLEGMKESPWGLQLTLPVTRTVAAGYEPPPYSRDFPDTKIRMVNGNPALTIGGKVEAPVLWAASYGNYRRYSQYVSSGVKMFRAMIEGHAVPAPGEQEQTDKWWFGEVDRMVYAALAEDPEIKLLPAVWMDPNPEWLFENSSEQFVSGRGQVLIPIIFSQPDKSQARPTFMSQAWRKAGAEGLTRLVKHMRSQPYAPHIMGLIFFAGRAGENYYGGNELNIFMNDKGQYDARPRDQWDVGDFSTAARRTFRDFLMRKYKTDAALQAAWQNPSIHFDDVLEPARFVRDDVVNILTWANKPPGAGTLRDPLEPGVGTLPMDYYQCFSEAMIDSFSEWGRAVKEASDNKLVTGCYYGYTLAQLFTAVPGFGGHTAVDRAARTPYVDIFVSPAEYDNDRRAGGHLWGHNIIDSLRLHNKLWIYEADTRTYLSDIVPKQYSLQETLEVLKRDAAASIVRGSGWWWLEFASMQRGAAAREWFDDPGILKLAGQIKRLYDFSLTLPDQGPSAEIAIFYHGETHTGQDISTPTLALNIAIGRMTLVDNVQRIGAPYDLYNLADLPDLAKSGKLSQYKLCLFLNPFYLQPEEVKWLELAKGGGRTVVWLYAPGLAQNGKHLAAENVEQVIGMKGLKLLAEPTLPTMRFTEAAGAVTTGLPAGYELAPRAFLPGQMWERWGSELNPLPYLDPTAVDKDTRIVGQWVIGGQARADRGAFAIRKLANWTSVYSAVPYLSSDVMRNLARIAGVHVYRDSNDILYADKHFVVVHTGEKAATDVMRLPRKTAVTEAFSGKVLTTGATEIKLDVPPYTTAMYYLGQAADLPKQ